MNNQTGSFKSKTDLQESEDDDTTIVKEALDNFNHQKETKNQVDNFRGM